MFSVGSIGAIGRGGARSLDALWRLAGFTPSFDFPFARNRSLVDAVSGQSLIVYTQASSGTYVNSSGIITTAISNEPRFDHDPATGESLGLPVEEQRTNSLPHSACNSTWVTNGFGVATYDLGLSALGVFSGVRVASAGQNWHSIFRSGLNLPALTAHAFTLFYRAGTSGRVRLTFRNNSNATETVINGFAQNLSVSSVSAGAATIISQYLCLDELTCVVTGTFTPSVASADYWFRIGPDSSASGQNVIALGGQLESGVLPTSYIPTGASTVTRSASLADLISSAIANNIRSFYVEFRSPAIDTRGVVSLNDNTANNRAAVITSGTDPRLVVHSGGVEQANINGGTVTAGARTRVAVRINDNDFAISINGGAVVTDTSGTLPTVDRILIGRTQAGEFLNSRIAHFTGWNQLLGDATLRSLSSQ